MISFVRGNITDKELRDKFPPGLQKLNPLLMSYLPKTIPQIYEYLVDAAVNQKSKKCELLKDLLDIGPILVDVRKVLIGIKGSTSS